jgi:hypothetical protein
MDLVSIMTSKEGVRLHPVLMRRLIPRLELRPSFVFFSICSGEHLFFDGPASSDKVSHDEIEHLTWGATTKHKGSRLARNGVCIVHRRDHWMTLVTHGVPLRMFPQVYGGRSILASAWPLISFLRIFWLIVGGLCRVGLLIIVCRFVECTMVEARRFNPSCRRSYRGCFRYSKLRVSWLL